MYTVPEKRYFAKDMDPFLSLRIVVTRMYPLRGYILGMLTHTTALNKHSGEVMNTEMSFHIHSLASPYLIT